MPGFALGKIIKGKAPSLEHLRRAVATRASGWEEVVLEGLASKDPQVRAEAAQAAKHLSADQVKAPLAALLRDPYRPAVMAALDSIAFLGLSELVPAVSGLLAGADQSLKEEVAKCLARLGGGPAMLDLLDTPRLPSSSERTLMELGTSAIPTFVSALLDGRKWVRQNAALLLGKFKDRRAVPSLMVAVNDPDPDVRAAAVEALGSIGGADAVNGLINALADSQEKVRARAAESLGTLRDARAVVPLVALFSDPVRQVREAAVKALADIGSCATEALIMALREDNPGVREYAARTLAFVATRQALEPLLDALEDDEWAVRRCAADALGRLGDKAALPYLLAAREDPIDIVRERARLALDKLDPSGELRKTLKPLRRKREKRAEEPQFQKPREPKGPGPILMDLPEAYEVLGLGLDATKAHVRQRWKELMRQLHPDAVAHLPAADRAKAEEMAKRVNMAYDVLMKSLSE